MVRIRWFDPERLFDIRSRINYTADFGLKEFGFDGVFRLVGG